MFDRPLIDSADFGKIHIMVDVPKYCPIKDYCSTLAQRLNTDPWKVVNLHEELDDVVAECLPVMQSCVRKGYCVWEPGDKVEEVKGDLFAAQNARVALWLATSLAELKVVASTPKGAALIAGWAELDGGTNGPNNE